MICTDATVTVTFLNVLTGQRSGVMPIETEAAGHDPICKDVLHLTDGAWNAELWCTRDREHTGQHVAYAGPGRPVAAWTSAPRPQFPAEGITCTGCAYIMQDATSTGSRPARPKTGSLSMCLACGELALFVVTERTIRMRALTSAEQLKYRARPDVVRLLAERQWAADTDPAWPKAPTHAPKPLESTAIAQLTAALAELISTSHIAYANEDDLQAGIHELLQTHVRSAGPKATREVRLSDGKSRIDLFCEGVGIEVKIKGSAADVDRQLARYAKCPEIKSLILVTTKAVHHTTPRLVNGKTVTLVLLIEGGL